MTKKEEILEEERKKSQLRKNKNVKIREVITWKKCVGIQYSSWKIQNQREQI